MSIHPFLAGAAISLVLANAGPAQAATAAPGKEAAAPSRPSRHFAFVDATEGEEISEKIQAAVDSMRSRGGTVVLPPGRYTVARPINLSGSLRRYPSGGAGGIALEGNGAALDWTGPDEEAVIDLPGIAGCSIRNLTIRGQEGRSWRKVAGLRYRGGIERRNNGGKNNLFQSIHLERLGIGIETGGLFGPDLVGGTFINVSVRQVRIGLRFMGANVTSMILINPVIEDYREAAVQIIAFPGRQIRADENEPLRERQNLENPTVLMDADREAEIFQTDLPAWMTAKNVTYPTHWVTTPDGERRLYAGGGGLDVTIMGLRARTGSAEAWAVDTNWGAVRVYSGSVEGGGVFRSRAVTGFQHYTTFLSDISAPRATGTGGNSVEFSGKGPLYLVGGLYGGNVALGSNTRLFDFGARFGDASHGFRQLPQTGSATVDQASINRRWTVRPRPGQVELAIETGPGPDSALETIKAALLPNFASGGIWLDRESGTRWVVRWKNPAPKDSAIDVVLTGGSQHRAATGP